MAAAEILATGTGALNSSDVTITTTALAVAMKGFASDAIVNVSLKDDAGAYNRFCSITSDNPSRVFSAAGVYRFSRPASSGACGLFSG